VSDQPVEQDKVARAKEVRAKENRASLSNLMHGEPMRVSGKGRTDMAMESKSMRMVPSMKANGRTTIDMARESTLTREGTST